MIEEGVDDESTKPEAASKMEFLDEVFELSLELLNQSAKDLGMELPKRNSDFDNEAESKRDDLIFDSQLMKVADKYSDMVCNWYDKYELSVMVGSETLLDFTKRKMMDVDLKYQQEILDASEIIRWYQFIIPSKLFRALKSSSDGKALNNDFYQHDGIASAKVLMIAIDKSITAWSCFLEYFSDSDADIFPLLMLLANLRKKIETEFPEARDFIRPGFDI